MLPFGKPRKNVEHLGERIDAINTIEAVTEEPEVLGDGERADDRVAADDLVQTHADPPGGTSPGDVEPGVNDASPDGGLESRDRSQQRGLASAVRAEQGDDLAGIDGEIDIEQHLHGTVGDLKTFDRKHRCRFAVEPSHPSWHLSRCGGGEVGGRIPRRVGVSTDGPTHPHQRQGKEP